MDSFGIWSHPNDGYLGRDGSKLDCPSVELHVNLWDIDKGGTGPFVDIGISVPDYRAFDRICLYVPFVVQTGDLEDLSEVLLKNREVANLVFNDNCGVGRATSGAGTLEREDREPAIVYEFDAKWGQPPTISLDSKGRWTIVSFDTTYLRNYPEVYEQWQKLYLRFRIKTSAIEEELFCNIKQKNGFLESGFEATRVADIKFNMKRNISSEAIKKMKAEGNCLMTMSSVHFLLIEPANNDVESYGSESGECRKLEDEWSEYLWHGSSKPVGDLLAYHWKRKQRGEDEDPIQDYAHMARVTRAATNWWTILVYIAVGIILNMVASGFYELLARGLTGC
ncbi:MAG: hypothetical protein Q4A01_11235 [Coriobacteriales bacterium]|nr:hypothetical protein [Coriobacteriales bacterium]